jgi:hypothetical protein
VNGTPGPPFDAEAYRHPSGLIVICMYCRRTLRPESDGKLWEVVEEFVAAPPRGISHGLCGDCLEQHYPNQS